MSLDTLKQKTEQLIEYGKQRNGFYKAFELQTNVKFNGSTELEYLPPLNLKNQKNLNGLCQGCSNLKEANIETSNATSTSSTFEGCVLLIKTSPFNLVNCTQAQYMFYNCSSIETIVLENTGNIQIWARTFDGCVSLKTVGTLDLKSETNVDYLFYKCSSLTNVSFVENSIKLSISFAQSPLLSNESIQSIINGLATVETAQTLTLHADVKAKLTESQIAQITSKNWNLA